MNSRILIAILTVAVVLLSAGFAWHLWNEKHSKAEIPVSPPVVNPLAERPLTDSSKLDEERRRLAADFEKKVADYFKAQQTREAALREELTKAREEDRKRLEQEIAKLHEGVQGYASSLTAWRERVEERPEVQPTTGTEPAVPQEQELEAPPIPPAQAGDEGDADANQKMLQDILKIGAAAVCLAEPPLCPIAMLIANILGSLGTIEGGREVFETIGKVQRGEPVSADDLNRLLKMSREHPELGEPLGQILGTLVDEKDDAPSAEEVADIVRQLLPGETGGIPDKIASEIEKNASCDILKSFLERDGGQVRFASDAQKKAVHIAVLTLRSSEALEIWDSCLAPLETK